jgi:hypothetical protein
MLRENEHLPCAFRLTGENRAELLDVLQTQERCHFRDLITGDETWVYLDMKPGTVWLPADAELLVRVKKAVESEKLMPIVFCGIHGITHYCWLPKDSRLDLPFFVKKYLVQSFRKCSQIPKNSQALDFDSYGQCKGSHSKGNPRAIGCFPIQTHTAATV